MADEIVDPVAPVADAEPAAIEAPKPERNKGDERFGELTYRLRQAEATIERLSKPPPEEKPALVKPTIEQSGYDDDKHREAMDQYYKELVKVEAREEAKKLLAEERAATQAKARGDTFESRMSKLTPEQRENAKRAPVEHQDVADLIMESELGPEILLFLHENQEIAESIAKLSQSQRAKEIGRIEAKLEKPASTEKEPAPKPVSKAPPPAAKIDASEPSLKISTTDPESDKLSDEEWVKAENKRLAAKRLKK